MNAKPLAALLCCSLLLCSVACKRDEATFDAANPAMPAATGPAAAANSPATAATAAAPAAAEAPAVTDQPSLVSLSAGAYPIQRPSEYSVAYSTTELLDERANTLWTSGEHKLGPEVLVLELPERTVLKQVEFDCGGSKDTCAKQISIEMSDTDAKSGWQNLVDVELKPGENQQRFAVANAVPGRWLRLTVKNNHGADAYIELADFRAYGEQLTHTPFPDMTGTYESSLGEMSLKQEGTLVTGCYQTRGGTFEGGIEGRVIKVNWCDLCDTPQAQRGPAVLDIAPDGERFIGQYWVEGQVDKHGSGWDGQRKRREVGACPQWASAAADVSPAQVQLTQDLESLGRARVYGINFDSDSDTIRDESNPALDNIVRVLKSRGDWKLSIEGHTDATSTPPHNQDLSERRAASVKSYLTAAGIDAARLSTIGFDQDKPVAPNDTATGRAQNRRVELAKQ